MCLAFAIYFGEILHRKSGVRPVQCLAPEQLRISPKVVCLRGNLLFVWIAVVSEINVSGGEWPDFPQSFPRAVLYMAVLKAFKHLYGAQSRCSQCSKERSHFSFFQYLLIPFATVVLSYSDTFLARKLMILPYF